MAKPQDRIGVFAVGASHDTSLLAEARTVREALYEEPHKRWYELRRDLFEHLIRVAAIHRILTAEAAGDAFVKFVVAAGPSKTWDKATPRQRRGLALKHLNKVEDQELRVAIADVIAHPGDLGLWIATEASLPPEPDTTVGDDVDLEEVARKLDAYVAEQDGKDLRRKGS